MRKYYKAEIHFEDKAAFEELFRWVKELKDKGFLNHETYPLHKLAMLVVMSAFHKAPFKYTKYEEGG